MKDRLRKLMSKFGRSRFRYLEIQDGAMSVTAVLKPGARKPALAVRSTSTGPSAIGAASTAAVAGSASGDDKPKTTVPKPSIPAADDNRVLESHEVTPQTLLSPRVGHFYLTDPKRIKTAVLVPGAAIEEGQVIGLIESMKIRYEVKAEKGGVVAETLVEDGEAVEYGQPLARLQLASEGN